MLVVDFFNQYWLVIILSLSILTLLVALVLVIYNYYSNPKTFKDNLVKAKTINISITID